MEGGRAVHRAKGSSGLAAPVCHARRSLVNAGAPWPVPKVAEARVLGIQRKLHKWASDDPNRRLSDLHNPPPPPAQVVGGGAAGPADRGPAQGGRGRAPPPPRRAAGGRGEVP